MPTLAPTPLPRRNPRYDTLPPNDAHLQRIADHVSAYLQIVRSQLLATVPKAIVHCMVRGDGGGGELQGGLAGWVFAKSFAGDSAQGDCVCMETGVCGALMELCGC